jgi:hypothetical protein
MIMHRRSLFIQGRVMIAFNASSILQKLRNGKLFGAKILARIKKMFWNCFWMPLLSPHSREIAACETIDQGYPHFHSLASNYCLDPSMMWLSCFVLAYKSPQKERKSTSLGNFAYQYMSESVARVEQKFDLITLHRMKHKHQDKKRGPTVQ